MQKKIFYRVGTQDGGGMWYNPDGTYHGRIHEEQFKKLQCHNVPMPFDEGILGYLSVADSLEGLAAWFNDADMAILEPLGFKVLAYEATDYRVHQNHWIINQQTSVIVNRHPYIKPEISKQEIVLEQGIAAGSISRIEDTWKPKYCSECGFRERLPLSSLCSWCKHRLKYD